MSQQNDKSLKRPFNGDGDDSKEIKQSRIDDHFISASSSSKPKTAKYDPSQDYPLPQQITILSYNIDGLEEKDLQKRFLGVLRIVAQVNPEIIFFQEFVSSLTPRLHQVLEDVYNIFDGNEGCPYYTLTAVSKNIRIEKSEVINFSTSKMGRNMLCVEAKWNELDIRLINSHLESCWNQTKERKAQFSQAMVKLKSYSSNPNALSIFAGDLNIRDTEISNVPNGVRDAWIAAGSREDRKYTWDAKLNDNKMMNKSVRYRFDRLYFRSPYNKIDFWLEGTKRIEEIQMFPSDHFAIVCKFTVPKVEGVK